MTMKNLFNILAIFACFTLTAVGDVITPTGATSTTGISATDVRGDITIAINGVGLIDQTDPGSVLDDTHEDGFSSTYWMSANGSPTAGGEVLEFDLGAPFDVDGLHFWTYNRTQNRSMKTFDISYSTDGGATFTAPVSAASLGMTDWPQGTASGESPRYDRNFNTTLSGVTDIRFSNLQNHGGTYYTLAEIRFEGVSAGTPAGPVDPDESTVSASPTAVPANDIATSTLTITVRNSIGLPLSGKLVSLTGDGSATIETINDTTNASGEATFTVKSGTAGRETFTATSESVTITATASVDFSEVPTGDVITPTAATSTSTVGGDRIIDRAMDGSGLVDVSNPSSVLDDEHEYGSGANIWLSASGAVAGGAEELTFDLGGAYDMDTVYYWPYTRDNTRNLLTFDISFSTDGGSTFSTPVSAASLGMANWDIQANDRSPSFVEARSFSTLSGVTDIRFSNLQNHGDASYFALGEIRFGGVSVGTPTDYASWSGGAAANTDTNSDGVKNSVAYALGALDVNENAIGLLPSIDNNDPNNFVFTFNRDDEAEADPATTISVEYGTTLSSWTSAPNVGDGVTVDDSGASVGGLTPVIVTIPKALAADGRLFARLNVQVSP